MRWLRVIYWVLVTCVFFSCATPAASNAGFRVITHPDGMLYVGDIVSFEVLPPANFSCEGMEIKVSLQDRDLGHAAFGPFGVGGRKEAVLWWVWDTRDLQPGPANVTFAVTPGGPSWQETVTLQPQSWIPPPEPEAHWETRTSDCCTLNYITGTDAERDIALLARSADEEAADLSARLDTTLSDKIPVVFIPRVLGQGGFANEAIYISYLDNDYLGDATPQVLHHEFVHWFDNLAGGDLRPVIFQEGLAVYLSGGHFKPEPIVLRAAALLNLGWYIPLRTLTDDFYPQQHEIGYLEAAALVEYMIETYGWEPFNTFYRDIHPVPEGGDSRAIDAALQAHYGITILELESSYLDFLNRQTVTAGVHDDLRASVHFYDTIRRYQQAFDPSAYFMTAWLPDYKSMMQRSIVADILRHPHNAENYMLEAMLVHAEREMRAGHYMQVEGSLKMVNTVLDMLGAGK